MRSLGDVAWAHRHYGEARDLYQQALLTYREIGTRHGEADTLASLGGVARLQVRHFGHGTADAASIRVAIPDVPE